MKKTLIALIAFFCFSILGICGSTVFSQANTVYENTWYALRNTYFTVPDCTHDTTVVDPGGESVALNDGRFRVGMEGDYVIIRGGSVSVLKVYRTAPVVTITLDGTIGENACEGENLRLPVAIGESEIMDYTDYVVEISLGSEVLCSLTSSQRTFAFERSGEYTVRYIFTDVFSLTTELEAKVNVTSEPVIVMQEFPKQMIFGKSVTLDETYGYYRGVLYECDVVLKDKFGTRDLTEKTFKPVCDGKNELTFSCNIDGQSLTRSVVIDVEYGTESFFLTEGISEIREDVAYPECANVDKQGVYVRGNTGGIAYYAKTLNLRQLSESKKNIVEFQPYAESGGGISQVRVTMTDVYDASNTLSVYWWLNPWNAHLSYMLVEYNGQSIAISNESGDRGVVRNTYGAVAYHNFTGVQNKSCVPFNFRYDFNENAIYASVSSSAPNYKVLDMDNTAELRSWKPFGGFFGEEVYVSFSLTECNGAGIVVSEIGGEALDPSVPGAFANGGAIQVMRDSSIGEGVVGYEYVLPTALTEDVVFGSVCFGRRLEYLESGVYRPLTDAEGKVAGDVFMPAKSGDYRVVFSGYDYFGSPVEKSYDFHVKETPEDIFIVTNAPSGVEVCADFILPQADVSGGTGRTEILYQVFYNGRYRYMLPGERFCAEAPGSVTVGIFVYDELGFQKTTSYTVPVDSDKRFIVIQNMPKACVNGELFVFPDFKGLDYSKYGTKDFEIPLSVYIEGERVDPNKDFYVSTTSDFITLQFTTDDGSVSETRKIRVIPAMTESIADYLVFEREKVETEFYETGLNFKFQEDAAVEMPYALPFYDLSMRFIYLEGMAKFEKTEVILRSQSNEDQSITLYFSDVADGKAKMTFEGKEFSVVLESGTYNELSSYNGKKYNAVGLSFSKDGTVSIGGNEICPISRFDSGRKFAGFDGGKVYLGFRICGVSAPCNFILSYVANQSFNTYTQALDETMPLVGLSRNLDGEKYVRGSLLEFPQVVLGDVLSPKVTGTFMVRSPDGTVLKKDAPIGEPLSVSLDDYGYYQFIFTLTDGARNTGNKIFRVLVADETPPELFFAESVREQAVLGDTLVIPKISAMDDCGGANGVTYFIYLRTPDTLLVRVSEGDTVNLDRTGRYRLFVYAYDASMNINCISSEITVTERGK